MEESDRDIKGGRQDRSDMRTFHINHSIVILSRGDGEGSKDLLNADVSRKIPEIPRFAGNDKLKLWL